jgi:uncharacterized protein (DUF433 family)
MKKRKKRVVNPKLSWVVSMRQAAATIGVELEEITRAKESGRINQAFKGSRVEINAVIGWLADNPKPELVADESLDIPIMEIEEALKMRADRRRSEFKALQAAKLVVPKDQPLMVFAAVSKHFISRLFALEDRLVLMFQIPREEVRRELEAVLEPLKPEEFERLLKEAGGDKSDD